MRINVPVTLLFILFSCSSALATPVAADSLAKTAAAVSKTVKSCSTKAGDKAFAKLKFTKAIKKYAKSLTKDTDTAYLVQKIAEAYRVTGNYSEAEKWYAKIADNPKTSSAVKLAYADVLRANNNYTAAQKYYEGYAKSNPTATGVKEALSAMDKIPALSKDNTGAYKVEAADVNTAKSEYGPALYDTKLLYTSNRSNKKATYDKWNLTKDSKIYVASLDSTHQNEKASLKSKCKSYESTPAFTKVNNEIVFSAGNFKKKNTVLQNGQRLPRQQLYSAALEENKGTNVLPLALNNAQYTSTQPTITKDGKTLYFVSDKLGGYGGTDIYIAARDANGAWSNPQNLGPDVNTAFDEKFPFIANDGTLYFSSNSPAGLGGLDVYKTKPETGRWSKPENLGVPVNSNKDDFSFVMAADNKGGYLASNRDGGKGEDDIYHFTYDETKLDYKVVVRVEDALTQKPIPMASLALDCKTQTPENTLADKNGEKIYTLKGNKACTVQAMSNGYKPNSVEVTTKNKNTTVPIPLKPDVIKLLVT
ncbi:MAG: PD40 domain-containing protein, partial [Chitinophagales bacterium]|nr:PD40 domain-containing protein [Chitinophagales bacterium]